MVNILFSIISNDKPFAFIGYCVQKNIITWKSIWYSISVCLYLYPDILFHIYTLFFLSAFHIFNCLLLWTDFLMLPWALLLLQIVLWRWHIFCVRSIYPPLLLIFNFLHLPFILVANAFGFEISQVALTCMAKLRDERYSCPGGLNADSISSLDIIMVKQISNGACHSIVLKLIMAILRNESSESLRRRYG